MTSRSMRQAVSELFVAMGAERSLERAQLYADTLAAEVRCEECAVDAVHEAMTHARRVPSIAELVDDARDMMNSEQHTKHIVAPQLAGGNESFWHATAVQILQPHCDSRDEAEFCAAELWYCETPADADLIALIANEPIALNVWRARASGRDITAERVQLAWARARLAAERSPLEWSDAEWEHFADV